VIGADDITLDLNGHTIDGDGGLEEACADDEICDVGVINDGHTRVTIEDGSVREFALAVLVLGASDNRLLELSATRSIFSGVVIVDSPRVQLERSAVVANGLHTDQAGVALFASPHGRIAHNAISDNGDIGVFAVELDGTSFERNELSGNPEAGMLIEGSRNVFHRNRLSRNGEGITVGGDENVITRNHASDSSAGLPGEGGGLGIFVGAGHDNLVERNVVARASRVGIQLSLLPEELEGGPPAVNTVVRLNDVRGSREGVFVLATAQDTLLDSARASPVGSRATCLKALEGELSRGSRRPSSFAGGTTPAPTTTGSQFARHASMRRASASRTETRRPRGDVFRFRSGRPREASVSRRKGSSAWQRQL